MGKRSPLRLAHIMERSPSGRHGQRMTLEAVAGQRRHPEMVTQKPGAIILGEDPVLEWRLGEGSEGNGARLHWARGARGHQKFAGPHALEFLLQARRSLRARKLGGAEVAGREVYESQAYTTVALRQRRQIVILARLENLRIDRRSRRDHASDFALHEFRGEARILHLVADGYPKTATDELGDVPLRGMIGNAAHWDRHALLLVAGGQGDLQLFRSHHGVFKEELVEISQSKQQEGVGVALLNGAVLPHQRCGEITHGRV